MADAVLRIDADLAAAIAKIGQLDQAMRNTATGAKKIGTEAKQTEQGLGRWGKQLESAVGRMLAVGAAIKAVQAIANAAANTKDVVSTGEKRGAVAMEVERVTHSMRLNPDDSRILRNEVINATDQDAAMSALRKIEGKHGGLYAPRISGTDARNFIRAAGSGTMTEKELDQIVSMRQYRALPYLQNVREGMFGGAGKRELGTRRAVREQEVAADTAILDERDQRGYRIAKAESEYVGRVGTSGRIARTVVDAMGIEDSAIAARSSMKTNAELSVNKADAAHQERLLRAIREQTAIMRSEQVQRRPSQDSGR